VKHLLIILSILLLSSPVIGQNTIQDMLVEVAGIEPAYSLVNSGHCGVWCP